MKFELTIDCDNAAFEPDVEGAVNFEVARILENVADRLRGPFIDGPFTLLDANGNSVGTARFVDDEVDDREFLQLDLDRELS